MQRGADILQRQARIDAQAGGGGGGDLGGPYPDRIRRAAVQRHDRHVLIIAGEAERRALAERASERREAPAVDHLLPRPTARRVVEERLDGIERGRVGIRHTDEVERL